MKIIITVIVILIIIMTIIIVFKSNIEKFTTITESSYNQNTIEDLIEISYLPDNLYEKSKLNEYDIIEIYKRILIRSPTDEEIKIKTYLSKDELIEDLYNSFEYDKIAKLQTISADSNMESSIAKRNLTNKISNIYIKIYDKDVPDKMIVVLRDCYIHLRSNYYLFMAFIESKKYLKFENEIISSITMTKRKVLELFNKHFNLLELKLKAEEKIKSSKGIIKENSIEKIKDELDKITLNINIPETTNKIDINELKTYLKPLELKETYENKNDSYTLNQLLKVREPEKLMKELPKDSELYVRVYNPINYKQTYLGPAEFKPPICTSLGQPTLEVPVFLESKLLFQGTELDKAFENSQIGSIMPKFEYREYQDVRIN